MNPSHPIIERLARRRDDFVAWASRRLPSNADAEDVVQLALERANQRIEQLNDPTSAEAWFWRILHRSTADFFEQRERHRQKLDRFDRLTPDEQASPDVENNVCPCSIDELEKLSESLRDAVIRIDIHDDTAREAARALSISPGAARVRAHRGRKELRRRIEERCQVSTLTECLDCAC